MGRLIPAATTEGIRPGTTEQFWNLLLTDSQLLEKLRKKWPDFRVDRETTDGVNSQTGEQVPPRDSWVVRFKENGNERRLAITIDGGKVWLPYRFALYSAYVHLQSGGGS